MPLGTYHSKKMAREIDIKQGIDWTTVWLYAALVTFGLMNIYAAVYSPDNPISIFSISNNAGKQILFISLSFIIMLIVLFIDYKFYDSFAYILYGFLILVLIKKFTYFCWDKCSGEINQAPNQRAKQQSFGKFDKK